jgi:Ricin-type beta-trefoil lectin domain-like
LNQLFKINWNDQSQAFNLKIKAGAAVKCLDVNRASQADGAASELQECSNSDSQAWYFVPVAGESGRFIVVNKNSGKSLDVLGAGGANGTTVGQWELVNGNNQKWELRDWR